jgi:hypothetical protein
LSHECHIVGHNAGSAGWSVHFQIKNTNLSLIYDRGYLEVIKEQHGAAKNLSPKSKDPNSVTIEDLAHEVNKEFA